MCDICKRWFKNKTGLSIHKSAAHKPEKSISTNGTNIQKKRYYNIAPIISPISIYDNYNRIN